MTLQPKIKNNKILEKIGAHTNPSEKTFFELREQQFLPVEFQINFQVRDG